MKEAKKTKPVKTTLHVDETVTNHGEISGTGTLYPHADSFTYSYDLEDNRVGVTFHGHKEIKTPNYMNAAKRLIKAHFISQFEKFNA